MRRIALVSMCLLVGVACSSGDDGRSGRTATTASSGAALAPVDIEPEASSGCGGPTAVAGESRATMTSGDGERWYLRHVPAGYDATTPMPLVLDFHGYGEGAELHAQMSSLGTYGDQAGFITVTPQGIGAVPEWITELDSTDLAFVGDLLDQVEADLCVDTNRVYSTGLSNGARLTSAIACTYGDRIAAVSTVAGVRRIEDCTFTRAVPVVAFHGTADDVVPYTGGIGEGNLDAPAPDGSGRPWRDTLTPEEIEALDAADPPTAEVMAAWAERNDCAEETTERAVGDDVTVIAWDCPDGAATELYRITGGGHTWPGSDLSARLEPVLGRTTATIDANEVMWRFFEDHPLRSDG